MNHEPGGEAMLSGEARGGAAELPLPPNLPEVVVAAAEPGQTTVAYHGQTRR